MAQHTPHPNRPSLPPDFGKGRDPVIDDFAWIDQRRREPVSPLWFWVDEVRAIFDELEKEMLELLGRDTR
jgi:hypothetical protein